MHRQGTVVRCLTKLAIMVGMVTLCSCFGPATVKNHQVLLDPSHLYAADLIPKGWMVIEDVVPSTTLDVSKLKFRSFLKDGELWVNGKVLRKRAVELKGNLGLTDAKRFLAEQGKIPAKPRDFYIVFPGTVLRDFVGRLRVPYLDFHGGRWVLDFNWLVGGWVDGGHLACSE